MRILIDMGHPAHVQFFINFIWEIEKRGHEIKITYRDNDLMKRHIYESRNNIIQVFVMFFGLKQEKNRNKWYA